MAAQPINLLFLHGYTQTGALFHGRTRSIQKSLCKALCIPAANLHFPTGPIRLRLSDLPFEPQPNADGSTPNDDDNEWHAWWVHNTAAETYAGLDKTWEFLAEYMKEHGPFTGVVGFSQGAGLAAMLVSALEDNPRREIRTEGVEKLRASGHPPLRFGVCYAGFRAREKYDAFFEPKIRTPMLHVIGSLDTVVEEARSLALVNSCEEEGREVVYHPGGHYLPAGKQFVTALIAFIQKKTHKGEEGMDGKTEERAEDMDVPF